MKLTAKCNELKRTILVSGEIETPNDVLLKWTIFVSGELETLPSQRY